MVNSRNKGASGERELADLLRSWGGEVGVQLDLKRNLEQVRGGGHDLDGVPGLAIECKRVEQLAVATWWKQAVRQAQTIGGIPLLCYRQNRKPWRFMVRAPVTFLDSTGAAASTRWLDLDMDQEQGRLWYQGYLLARGLGATGAALGGQEPPS